MVQTNEQYEFVHHAVSVFDRRRYMSPSRLTSSPPAPAASPAPAAFSASAAASADDISSSSDDDDDVCDLK